MYLIYHFTGNTVVNPTTVPNFKYALQQKHHNDYVRSPPSHNKYRHFFQPESQKVQIEMKLITNL